LGRGDDETMKQKQKLGRREKEKRTKRQSGTKTKQKKIYEKMKKMNMKNQSLFIPSVGAEFVVLRLPPRAFFFSFTKTVSLASA
jgi:hypothetical protein